MSASGVLYAVVICLIQATALSAIAVPDAHAICLNPFGCNAAETRGECLKEARTASTEAVARALVSQCNLLPTVALAQCKQAEVEWAAYLRQSGGVEWTWPARPIKSQCREYFPASFAPSTWVTPKYCNDAAAKLARTADDFDQQTRESLKVARARKDTQTIGDATRVVEIIQLAFYPNIPAQEVAAAMNVDAPPDQLAVAAYCSQLTKSKKQ